MKSSGQVLHCLEQTERIAPMTVLSLSSLSFVNKTRSCMINHLSQMNTMTLTPISVERGNSAVQKKVLPKMNQLVSTVVMRVSLESMMIYLTSIRMCMAVKNKLTQRNSSRKARVGTSVTLVLL